MSIRLQKLLADAGYGSRRSLEALIAAGKISVNSTIAKLGDKAEITDNIKIENRQVKLKQAKDTNLVLIYNKPEGEICSSAGRNSVFHTLPKINDGRWIMVGRLDVDTSGLLLFCNDGNLANNLMHPKFNLDREYSVRVFGNVTPEHIKNLKKGVMLADGFAKFSDIVVNDNVNGRLEDSHQRQNNWFTVCMQTGKNREVRRLWESQNLQVSRLKRVRYGPIFLPSTLKKGKWQYLEKPQVLKLRDFIKPNKK